MSQAAEKVPAVAQAAGLPARAEDYLIAHGGAGFEYGSARDYIVPRLSVLQKNSPQVDEALPEFIKDAKVGQFFVKGETAAIDSKEGIVFVPCMYKPQYLEWKPRDNGGGLVAVYEEAEALKLKTVRQGAKDVLANGNHLQRHSNIFGLLVDVAKGEWRPFVMSLASTQQKYASMLYTQLKNQTREVTVNGRKGKVTLPMFLNVVRATTKAEANQSGSWYSFSFERLGDLLGQEEGKHFFEFAEQLAADAAKFSQDIKSGMAKAEDAEFDPETGEVPF
jgi:hypothetical protein